MHERTTIRSVWNLFPWVIVSGMTLVVAVNVGMVVSAIGTFPGKAGRDGFDLSNRYNAVIDRVQAQALLGWMVATEVDAKSRPVIILSDATGSPLVTARVTATARRPLGEAQKTELLFEHTGGGRYLADTPLTTLGQWDLLLTVTSNTRELMTTRRIVLR